MKSFLIFISTAMLGFFLLSRICLADSDYLIQEEALQQLRIYKVDSLRAICLILAGTPDTEITDRNVGYKYTTKAGTLSVSARRNSTGLYVIYDQFSVRDGIEQCAFSLAYAFHVKYETPLIVNSLPQDTPSELPLCQSHENQKRFNGKWYRKTDVQMIDKDQSESRATPCSSYIPNPKTSSPSNIAFEVLSDTSVNTGRSSCGRFNCPIYSQHCTIAIYSDLVQFQDSCRSEFKQQ